MSRIGNFFRVLFVTVLSLIGGAIILGLGYWASEIAYDSGYLMVGFALRIFLVLTLIGIAFSLLWNLGVAVYALFGPEMEW